MMSSWVPRMKSGNFASKSLSLSGSTVSANCTYQLFVFPNVASIDTRNVPSSFTVYRQRFLDAPWLSIGSIPYNVAQAPSPLALPQSFSGNFSAAPNPTYYNYKFAVVNPGGESTDIATIPNQSSYKPSLSFYANTPYYVNTNQTYSTFSVQGISGIVSDVANQYQFAWYVNTDEGWFHLDNQWGYPITSPPSLLFPSYMNYVSYYPGSGRVEVKCEGTNPVTGQIYASSVDVSCGNCNFTNSKSFSAPLDTAAFNGLNGRSALPSVNEEVELYPNPVTEILSVNIDNHSNYVSIRIFNSWGNEVKTVSPVNATNYISVQDLPTGNYILVLVGNNMSRSFKFTKM